MSFLTFVFSNFFIFEHLYLLTFEISETAKFQKLLNLRRSETQKFRNLRNSEIPKSQKLRNSEISVHSNIYIE